MHSKGLLLKTALCAICFVLLQGCGSKDVVSEEKMVDVLVDMFIADQSLEIKPDLLVQKDSMLVYPPIMLKHGVTVEQFEASMRYYVDDGESYLNILKEVKSVLYGKNDAVAKLMKQIEDEKRSRILTDWWAVDSIRCMTSAELKYDRYLRAVRWLVVGDRELGDWKFTDSLDIDIPQNGQWWHDNMVPQNRKFIDLFLKDADKEETVTEALETEDKKKITDKKDEKVSSKLLDNSRRKRPGVKEGVRSLEL